MTAAPAAQITAQQLTPLEMEIIEFERLQWKYLGRKEAVIRQRFQMSLTRYSQLLNRLLDEPAAEAYDPMTVRRLKRLRDQRRSVRARTR